MDICFSLPRSIPAIAEKRTQKIAGTRSNKFVFNVSLHLPIAVNHTWVEGSVGYFSSAVKVSVLKRTRCFLTRSLIFFLFLILDLSLCLSPSLSKTDLRLQIQLFEFLN